MGDSFFGFNTKMPPLSQGELRRLGDNGDRAVEETEVFDFDTLQDTLDDEEQDDGLGDQLIEENDDYNDETFGSGGPIGQDFDFASNTEKFKANTMEEEAFFVKRGPRVEERTNNLRNPWGASPIRDRTPVHDRNTRQFAESPPITNSSSIWGNFAGGLSTDRGFGSLSSNNNLSPFGGNRNHGHPSQSRESPYTPSPPPGLSPSSSFGQPSQRRSQPVRLEDIEAELQRQAASGRAPREMEGKKMLSLAEVEAAMLAGSSPSRVPMQDPNMLPFGVNGDPMQLMALRQQQQELLQQQLALERELQRKQTPPKSRYDELMTQRDKDFINRVQLSQLAQGDPYSGDFYYQVYTSLRQRAGLPTWASTHTAYEHSHRGGRGQNKEDNMMQRMQQQLQRIVNDAKRRPKQTQVSLEGALGKITSLTVRNPRQVLQVSDKKVSSPSTKDSTREVSDKRHPVPHGKQGASTLNDRRRTLRIVESLYDIVLKIEQLRRQGPARNRSRHEEDEEDAMKAWNEACNAETEKLWEALGLSEANNESTPDVIGVLSIAKGKKLIPRIVRHLTSEQNLTMITAIVSHFAQLQVCRHVIYPGTMVANAEEAKAQQFVTFEDVELFMNTAAPPLLSFIAEAPLNVVNKLLYLFMDKNDTDVVARSKPGLAFLTMLLSRAEILKQGGGALQGLMPPSSDDLAQWHEAYNRFFDLLQTKYAHIFPSLYYLVPVYPNTNMLQLSLDIDDMYVWQFLAAMAVGASMDQQHILVTEIRDRVMENIVLVHSNRLNATQAAHKISNVNLFLHALGLDASQVSIPR
ncbi:topoisomerase II-associated protein PAT1-domain-containing protein [Radiomyces spectabilis]|uniref:topoisomerase II-associated protein PAT1-domain-containing protein n=1 Tax=Radiomyces spectabilis TaxID=64574 RepID=UPI00221F3C43|nr:topoisomerase II-associated protein PAT1-domain-containing protein [Radiomyces spectabilis]KAI8381526.1 topoisomerase II-associated protein PAT1-domain-containing protein [Radiomyces spectabilis]